MKNIIKSENIGRLVKFRNGDFLKIIDIEPTSKDSVHYPKFTVLFENNTKRMYWQDGTVSVFENSPYDIIEIILLN